MQETDGKSGIEEIKSNLKTMEFKVTSSRVQDFREMKKKMGQLNRGNGQEKRNLI